MSNQKLECAKCLVTTTCINICDDFEIKEELLDTEVGRIRLMKYAQKMKKNYLLEELKSGETAIISKEGNIRYGYFKK